MTASTSGVSGSLFNVSGLSSGLDTKTIISQLMSIDSAPKTKLQWNQQLATTRQGVWNDLKTKLGAVKTAANALNAVETWNGAGVNNGAWSATSADPSRLGASVNGTPTAGTYNITVQQLAQGEIQRSSGSLGAGLAASDTLTLTQGGSNWNVAVAAGDQLSDIAAKINATAGIGAFAQVVGGQLQLQSNASGAAAAFTVTSAGGAAAQLGMTETQSALDAHLTVNGTGYFSSSNSGITAPIAGVSLSLSGTTDTTLTVGQATSTAFADGVVAKVKAFADAYNAALDFVNQKTQVESKVTTPADPATGITLNEYLTGPLARNFDMENVSYQMQGQMSDLVSGLPNAQALLESVGITSSFASASAGGSGKLSVDETKLRAALTADPTSVQKLFGQDGGSVGPSLGDGFMRRISKLTDQMTSYSANLGGQTGIVGGAIAAQGTAIKSLQDSINSMQTSLDAKQAYYEKMFSNMESMLGKLQSQGSWLSSQLAQNQSSTSK